jgi:hypothetical protein
MLLFQTRKGVCSNQFLDKAQHCSRRLGTQPNAWLITRRTCNFHACRTRRRLQAAARTAQRHGRRDQSPGPGGSSTVGSTKPKQHETNGDPTGYGPVASRREQRRIRPNSFTRLACRDTAAVAVHTHAGVTGLRRSLASGVPVSTDRGEGGGWMPNSGKYGKAQGTRVRGRHA